MMLCDVVKSPVERRAILLVEIQYHIRSYNRYIA
jgi:hypothetical protein